MACASAAPCATRPANSHLDAGIEGGRSDRRTVMVMNMRFATPDDTPEVLSLYRRVAQVPGGIARLAHEVSEAYVRSFLSKAEAAGIALVVHDEFGGIIAEIHAYRPGLYCFSHVLSDLTIVVDPAHQGSGVGRKVFEAFMNNVSERQADISRVELIARRSNRKAIRFYKSLGFNQEGELTGRIRSPDGGFESDIPMAWSRE